MATLKVCSQVCVCVSLERVKAKKKQFHGIVRRCGCVCDSVPAYTCIYCLLEKALLEVCVSLKELVIHDMHIVWIYLFKNIHFKLLNSYLIINDIYK